VDSAGAEAGAAATCGGVGGATRAAVASVTGAAVVGAAALTRSRSGCRQEGFASRHSARIRASSSSDLIDPSLSRSSDRVRYALLSAVGLRLTR
jgi:hypothetical protein